MNTQRITISLPKYLYDDLVKQVNKGQISGFITNILEKELTATKTDPIDEFIKLREKLPQKKQEEIIKAIKKSRL